MSNTWKMFNPLKTELNPICHLLALLGAHHILHVSRIRVNTDGNKPLCNKKAQGMAIAINRGTSQIWTTSNCRKMNTKCSYMHVNNIHNDND
jgi:hypothetical protein